jgi:hypothetical protein
MRGRTPGCTRKRTSWPEGRTAPGLICNNLPGLRCSGYPAVGELGDPFARERTRLCNGAIAETSRDIWGRVSSTGRWTRRPSSASSTLIDPWGPDQHEIGISLDHG